MNTDHSFRDDVFGDLRWESEGWEGTVQFLGRQLTLLIDFDVSDPTDDEIRLAIESARKIFPFRDEAWERKARLDAAKEVTHAVYCQSEHVPTDQDVQQLLDDMMLESLDFTYSSDDEAVFPYLAYASPNCFPGMSLCIQFATDLTIEEVTVNEKPSANG